jgi:hypothetical protein
VSACEDLTVEKATPAATTTLHNAANNAVIEVGSTVPLGTSIFDTAAVGPVVASIPITGSVTYRFFTNGTCTSPPLATQTLPVGTQSATQGPLHAGTYAFDAVYNGNANYNPSPVSACEDLTVEKATPAATTTLHNAADNAVIEVGSTVPLGTSIFDTAAVGPVVAAIPITGTVTYRFFTNGTCTGTPLATQTLPLGTQSATQGPLHAGTYAFDAVYNGNPNYNPSPASACEDLTVEKATPAATTTLHNAAGATIIIPVGSAVPLGTKVLDRATVGPQVDSIPISGTVTYRFFHNGDCTGTPAFDETKAVGAPSTIQGPLPAGTYAFDAVYNGNANYNPSPVSACEHFTVSQSTPTTDTTLHDATTQTVIGVGDSVLLGSSVFDTATVGPEVAGFPITGTVTYQFFHNGTCTDDPAVSETLPLGSPSSTQTALQTGTYAFDAVYNGNANYTPSPTSICEHFFVAQNSSTMATTVKDAAGHPVTTAPLPLGSVVHDTSTVTGVPAVTPSGTVTYTFFGNNDCTQPGSSAGMVTLTSTGSVPDSHSTKPLAAGHYSFQAFYSGDSNYAESTSACEEFSIAKADPSPATKVMNDTTNKPASATDLAPSSFHDTATVTAVTGFTPTGTVTYRLFATGDCSGPVVSTHTVTLSGGRVPPSASTPPLTSGTYSFHATYSGDANYESSTAACEPFTLAAAPTPPPELPPTAPPAPITNVTIPVTG